MISSPCLLAGEDYRSGISVRTCCEEFGKKPSRVPHDANLTKPFARCTRVALVQVTRPCEPCHKSLVYQMKVLGVDELHPRQGEVVDEPQGFAQLAFQRFSRHANALKIFYRLCKETAYQSFAFYCCVFTSCWMPISGQIQARSQVAFSSQHHSANDCHIGDRHSVDACRNVSDRLRSVVLPHNALIQLNANPKVHNLANFI